MVDPLKVPEMGARPVEISPLQMRTPQPRASEGGLSFKAVLADAVKEVQRLQNEADNTIKQLVAGEITDVAEAMLAVERADVAFQTMMTVRNKVVAAYEEIMRMQV